MNAVSVDQSQSNSTSSAGSERKQRKPIGSAVKCLVDVTCFSSLSKLVDVIAWVRRAAKIWLNKKNQGRTVVISASKCNKTNTLTPMEQMRCLKTFY